MNERRSFYGQPIRSLQSMLRTIALYNDDYELIIPDGIFGPQTASAVSTFQRRHGLPITGSVDQETWDAIVLLYEAAQIEVAAAEPLNIDLAIGEVIAKGATHPYVLLVQSLLTEISNTYHSIGSPSRSGILDELTSNSLSDFQQLNDLPMTGVVDKATWKHLALQYPLSVLLK